MVINLGIRFRLFAPCNHLIDLGINLVQMRLYLPFVFFTSNVGSVGHSFGGRHNSFLRLQNRNICGYPQGGQRTTAYTAGSILEQLSSRAYTRQGGSTSLLALLKNDAFYRRTY